MEKLAKLDRGEKDIFSMSLDLLKFSDRRLQESLKEIRHQFLKGKISAEEAKRFGREAVVRGFNDAQEMLEKSAKKQGLEVAPVKIYSDWDVEEAVLNWVREVDDLAKIRN